MNYCEKIAMILADMKAILAESNETPEERQRREYMERREVLPPFKSTDRK